MSRILVTGANGFVGAATCRALRVQGHEVVPTTRRPSGALAGCLTVGEIGPDTEWGAALAGVETVVHLAAVVHRVGAAGPAYEAELKRVNADGTAQLVTSARRAGVQRFLYLSTIKVHGETTAPGVPFSYSDVITEPEDPYARSKWLGEQVVMEASDDFEWSILRSPLVYGPGVKANFLRLMQIVDRGVPLPLGRVDNRRSLLGVNNLADAISQAATSDHSGVLLLSDGTTISTPELIRRIARSLKRPARLLPVWVGALTILARAGGKRDVLARLVESLEIDIDHTRKALRWQPPFSTADEMRTTADWFLAHHR